MLKVLIIIIKLAVFIGAAVWIASQPGSVQLDFQDFEGNDLSIRMTVGVFLAFVIGLILLAIFAFRIISWFGNFPKTWSRYKREVNREKGYQALTRGLSAVAAGDTDAAVKQAEKAEKWLAPVENHGLTYLLSAQAARLQGDEGRANQNFLKMVDHKDTAVMGLRGLLQSALDHGNHVQAKELTERALKLYPKQEWILRSAYYLQIQTHDFESALKTLKTLERHKRIPPEKAGSDRIAIFLYQGDKALKDGERQKALKLFEKAHKLDPLSIPATLKLGRLYIQQGKTRKCLHRLEKIWPHKTHPQLAELWAACMPKSYREKPAKMMQWFERLLALNPRSAEAQLAAARAAIECRLWGEAENYLKMAESIRPSPRLYRIYALLAEKSNEDKDTALYWLERASEAPADKSWVCAETGALYDEWHAFAAPHNSFNTIVWDLPSSISPTYQLEGTRIRESNPILEPPHA